MSISNKPLNIKFDNAVLRNLPLDKDHKNSVRQVTGAIFSLVKPTPLEEPECIAYWEEPLKLLGLNPSDYDEETLATYFSGNELIPGSESAAHCYCGHQFGYFSGQLGDGRAMYLGEAINPKGERWEIQLKGAGPTPYSRAADGRAVLRSSIREFLCSEAMHYLGVPTTRAGTLIVSQSTVVRDLKYDGHPRHERCAVVSRIAPTFIRFGSFEIFLRADQTNTNREGSSKGNYRLLKLLLDYIIKTYFPHIWNNEKLDDDSKYLEWFKDVVTKTAEMVAWWQAVGFAHGVLNTDNMSIMGLTLDYGPFGFLDAYDPQFICNGSDHSGRYAFDQQPDICQWNCQKLAEAISPEVPIEKTTPIFTTHYKKVFGEAYMNKMRNKLGLLRVEDPKDGDLIYSLLDIMTQTGADMTNTFRSLARISIKSKDSINSVLEYILQQIMSADQIASKNKPEVPDNVLEKMMAIAARNPYLLEYMTGKSAEWLEKQIEKKEAFAKMKSVNNASKTEADTKAWTNWIQKYHDRLQMEIQGATDVDDIENTRVKIMNANNPKFILRNYIAENIIKKAEKGDYTELHRFMKVLQDPYGEGEEFMLHNYDQKAPDWSTDICVTCSS